MLSEPKLFEFLRHGLLGPTLSPKEVDGVQRIVGRFSQKDVPASWVAYALATAYHETAGTMQPIKEFGSESYFIKRYDVMGDDPSRARRMGNTEPGDGPKYCGRGYVQLTWKSNYAHAEKKIGRPLVDNPDLAMDPQIAAEIMARGMMQGWFTGKRFEHSLPLGPANEQQFYMSRKIINGLDRATDIAAYALHFQKALQAADYGE